MNERAIRELEQMYMMLSEEKKKAIDEAIKALQAQSDGDIITALCSLPKIRSEDGQDYVQLYDVLETVRRYKPSVAIPSAEPYKGMTNGEVIKAMFGDDKVSEFMGYARIMARVGNWFNDGVVAEFDKDWWNSPYEPQESEE